jgi:hypothetical protein
VRHSRLVSVHGARRYLRSDNGLEFLSRAVLRWLTDAKSRNQTAHVEPGKADLGVVRNLPLEGLTSR